MHSYKKIRKIDDEDLLVLRHLLTGFPGDKVEAEYV